MIEKIEIDDKLGAVIIRNGFSAVGTSFLTNNDSSQQVAQINYSINDEIKSHLHEKWDRIVHQTIEVLFIKEGKIRVDFYNQLTVYLYSKILSEKDTIILFSGGHGFKVLEKLSMIEIKQGPFLKDDRKFFKKVEENKIIIK